MKGWRTYEEIKKDFLGLVTFEVNLEAFWE